MRRALGRSGEAVQCSVVLLWLWLVEVRTREVVGELGFMRGDECVE